MPGLGGFLDSLGILFAFLSAICWASYIIFGSRLAGLGVTAIAWAMPVAALLAVPLGLSDAGSTLFLPQTLWAGLMVAIFSSALPYSLELLALRSLPASVFSALFCFAPAFGAIIGYVILGERLAATQWVAVAIIILSAISVIRAAAFASAKPY